MHRLNLTRRRAAFALGLLGAAAAAGNASAGVITYVPFSNDADSGISTANTYTHAVDPGDSAGVTVNGVFFTPYEFNSGSVSAPQPFQHNGAGGVASGPNGDPSRLPAGDVGTLMSDFIWGGSATDETIVGGLTPGVTYDARIYIRQWDVAPRTIAVVFDEDNFGPLAATTGLMDQDDATTRGFATENQTYYINYRYTATTEPLRIVVGSTAADQYHFYAFTNQVVPEPAALSLLALGGVGLLARRRPRR